MRVGDFDADELSPKIIIFEYPMALGRYRSDVVGIAGASIIPFTV
jgi:hypothetical protein